ncbi:MAG TPA: hypothetical protein VF128_11415 [Gemmatimonadaceae bacterium]
MTEVRWIRRFMLLAVLSTTACGIVEPCDFNLDNNMDGTWQLTRINGQPIPAHGVVVPGTTHRLVDGDVFFKTYTYTKCEDALGRITSGSLVAQYYYVDVVGQPAGHNSRGAKFIYDNETGALTISAAGRSANGDRFANEFTVQQDFGDITYALTFVKVIN